MFRTLFRNRWARRIALGAFVLLVGVIAVFFYNRSATRETANDASRCNFPDPIIIRV